MEVCKTMLLANSDQNQQKLMSKIIKMIKNIKIITKRTKKLLFFVSSNFLAQPLRGAILLGQVDPGTGRQELLHLGAAVVLGRKAQWRVT